MPTGYVRHDGADVPYLDDGSGHKRLLTALPTPKEHPMKAGKKDWSERGFPTYSVTEVEQHLLDISRKTAEAEAKARGHSVTLAVASAAPELSRIQTSVPIIDQNGVGACVPPGTRVRMADGSLRPIEGVKLLDEVLTAEGNTGKVLETMARHHKSGLIRLMLWGHGHLRLTADHPVLTRRGYVPAGELTLEDFVAIPKYIPARKHSVLTADHVKMGRRLVSTTRQLRTMSVAGRTTVTPKVNPVPDSIALNRGFGRIMGLFLAEGNSSLCKTEWTFAEHEGETLVEELRGLLADELGIEAHCRQRGNKVWKVTAYGTPWAKLAESLCGAGCKHKRIHPDLASGPRDFAEGLFTGWFDGDGSYKDPSRCTAASISHDLAMGMYDLANALGYKPSIELRFPKPNAGVRERQPAWYLRYARKEAGDNYRVIEEETHVWRRVRGIEMEEYEGYVFNLEVEGDHSYVAEGIGVHNCLPHAFATACMVSKAVAGDPYVDLDPFFLYTLINGGRDQGSNAGDAVQALTSVGICPRGIVPYGTVRPKGYSTKAMEAASACKLRDAVEIKGYEQFLTAILLGWGVTFDVQAGGRFNTDSDGVCGYLGGWTNHEVFAGEEIKKVKGVLLPGGRNSWDVRWGVQGRCLWTPRHCDSSNTSFALRFVYGDPNDHSVIPLPG